VGRATNAQRSLRHRADALAALNLAISANDELLVQRALGEALKCPGVRHDHPTVRESKKRKREKEIISRKSVGDGGCVCT
jgi:hypothetical protein